MPELPWRLGAISKSKRVKSRGRDKESLFGFASQQCASPGRSGVGTFQINNYQFTEEDFLSLG